MFIRKKLNKSGTVSIQIIDKSSGYKVMKTIGSAKDPNQIKQLEIQASSFIRGNQQSLFTFKTQTDLRIEDFLRSLSNAQIHTIGPELIFGTVFDRIGFNVIPEEFDFFIRKPGLKCVINYILGKGREGCRTKGNTGLS